MANLEAQKEEAELMVYNILLGDMRVGPAPTVSEESFIFLQAFTHVENLHDLFHVIMRITEN